MIVTAIISSAVLALSNAVASAYQSAQENSRRNATVRSTGVFFSDAVKSCNLVLSISDSRICFWINDDNMDSKINPSELQYFDYASNTNELNIVMFSGAKETTDVLNLEDFNGSSYMEFLVSKYKERKITLSENCVDLKFSSDNVAPQTRLVHLSFDIAENERKHHFEFTVNKQTLPSAWLNFDGALKSANDDD